MTVTVQTAARIAHVSTGTIRTWCHRGILVAVKSGNRWMVSVRSLATHTPLRMPADRYRPGQHTTAKTGRGARARHAGNAMSVMRRHAVLDALVARVNAGRLTAATYLLSLGADADFIRRHASGFGKAAAKAHRNRTGVDPQRNCIARVGRRLVACFSYDPADLADAARDHKHTAALLAA